MLMLEAQLERGSHPDSDVAVRIAALRRQITLYRQQLRQSFDPEFVAIYAREIAEAQFELANHLDSAGPHSALRAWQGRREIQLATVPEV
jgi:hypothetical protein